MIDLPHVVGIYSPAPRSGKSALAQHLATEYGYVIVPFAAPLKKMTRSLLECMGFTHERIDQLLTTDKECILPGIRTTPRHILQALGTEFGRDCIHPSLWLNCWMKTAGFHLTGGTHVVCDDVRFPNEADLIRDLGGELWHVSRPGALPTSSHSSEGSLDDYPHFTRRFHNAGSLDDLFAQLPFATALAA